MQYETLKDCIATLERVRHAYCSQLDASVVAELDDVVSELKRHAAEKGEVELGITSVRALEIISLIVSLVTNITNMLK